MTRRSTLRVAIALFAALAVWQFAGGLYIKAKAVLAQHLLERAWRAAVAGDGEARPWPWADTWPVARLAASGHDIDQIVLSSASGRTLAFAPGHVNGTALPGRAGNSVVGGHRDTHFRFLKDLRSGDEMHIERPDGVRKRYRVVGAEVLDHRRGDILEPTTDDRLTLVTCYPFDALRAGGPSRYVVTARAVGD